ncbi:MAG TPA: class I poly(R)-hydroxyalkanoic acid synthase, partial [Marinobacter sp.]|uniref:Class I poly(R)-hydroxyalkanoic acid synthase n=2 Tax=root TaxID=1 RepID=A0A831R728_9GAMM|nr:class I poly(R)-hydroxyalkanoic acid synthase [Marinobacter antarcticus]HDZ37428.1 class I poly(R)-hydroxyalkanoic acid synthase [Marinobacter sp.]HEA53545.1 class I poly(R)-hydroxyalkanoic acid synthase [Marinobacter antarcticus]
MSEKPIKTEHPEESELNVVRNTVLKVSVHGGNLLKRSLMRRLRPSPPSPVSIKSMAKPFVSLTGKLATQPDTVILAQMRLIRDSTRFWSGLVSSSIRNKPLAVIEPEQGDARFRDQGWDEILAFNVIKQAYLLSNRWIMDTIDDVRGMDKHTRRKLRFFTGQMTDALAPSNFILSNPEVLRTTIRTRGTNLLRGLGNLMRDLDQGHGPLPFRMSDPDAFTVGGNLANTPGDVVFQNELMQLIQYKPTTDAVHRRPLLVVPPWINKYYILDLGEKKSFIRYWVEHGHTVFVISWINPGAALAHKSFEDYMLEGPIAAMDAIERATGERELNTVGYCIGGTLLGCTLAWLAARDDDRIKSATFLNSLLDFSDVGDLEVFIDEDAISKLEKAMNKQGYLDGASMATAFNMLRANSLIWSFFVNNYLLGRDTAPFDLLYWNADATRMPAAMHSFYLRNMYMQNRVREPGGIELAGTPIDLGKVKVPSYFASAIEDHIAPWTSSYKGSRCFAGPVRFILGGSGHIAGIINPPDRKKYGYRLNEDNSPTPDAWLTGAKQFEGSWWPDWAAWIEQFGGGEVKARTAGEGELPVIEPAPGAYVQGQSTLD